MLKLGLPRREDHQATLPVEAAGYDTDTDRFGRGLNQGLTMKSKREKSSLSDRTTRHPPKQPSRRSERPVFTLFGNEQSDEEIAAQLQKMAKRAKTSQPDPNPDPDSPFGKDA